jgi:hypothetical protein
MIEVYYSNAVVHCSCGRVKSPGHKIKNSGPLSFEYFLYIVSTTVDKNPWERKGGYRIGSRSARWIVFFFMQHNIVKTAL